MNLYISVYHHRHGQDVLPMYQSSKPTEEDMVKAWTEAKADLELEREDEYLECRGPFPAPNLNTRTCDSPGCPGWIVTVDQGAIERCDTCARFDSDDEAVAHVCALEALDMGLHFEAHSYEALKNVKAFLTKILPDMSGKSKKEIEWLLDSDVWTEENLWTDHARQFVRLLSEIYATGEPSEDTETMKEQGYFSIKISDIEESMDLPWHEILSIFERADTVFQAAKAQMGVKS